MVPKLSRSTLLSKEDEAVCVTFRKDSGSRRGRGAYRTHMFDPFCPMRCSEHRLAKPNHPWTNGPIERMNQTLKEGTVKRYRYGSSALLRAHFDAFLAAYKFVRRLKTLRGVAPHEFIGKA